jgi:hypothetical protein
MRFLHLLIAIRVFYGGGDHLAAQAKPLSLAGFTAVWLPPVLKSASGSTPGADGYGPFDVYDIGSKKQKGSIAHIARLSAQMMPPPLHHAAFALSKTEGVSQTVDVLALDEKMALDAGKPPVVVGITPGCPYGIGACWGGAFDALQQLDGIKDVRPVPDSRDSTAFVYLKEDTLPDIDAWREQFTKVANGSYVLRGIEMTLKGAVTESFGLLTLPSSDSRPDVVLAPLQALDKIQWDTATGANQAMTDDEGFAYARLSAELNGKSVGSEVEITGPIKKNDGEFFLEVRSFQLVRA